MSFAVSFGSNSIKNGSSVNRNSVATSPSLVFNVPPGLYTITMLGVDVPFVHWIKCNMNSKASKGSIVANYRGPDPEIMLPQRVVVTLWHQTTGRLTPPPRAPPSRTHFKIENFAARHGLLEVASLAFLV